MGSPQGVVMSLNLSLITPRYVCQVSDRRLRRFNRDGTNELYTDQANKATVLGCRDAACAIAFHGIGAGLDGTPTDFWLKETLQKVNPSKHSIDDILEELSQKSSSWMMEIRTVHPTSALHHTFVLTGWVHARVPFIALVSNYQRLDSDTKAAKPWSEFIISARYLSHTSSRIGFCFFRGGSTSDLLKDDIELVCRMAQDQGAQPKDVVQIMARAIHHAAKKSKPKVISEISVSTVLLPGDPGVQCDQHYEPRKEVMYMPNIIGMIPIWGAEIYTGDGVPPWRIRDIRKSFPQNEYVTKGGFIKAMQNVPSTYRTGDQIPSTLDPVVTKFLNALPVGLSQREIEEAL
jgi:hypothetical protein